MTKSELPGAIRVQVKGTLRCEGPGRLSWGEDLESRARVAVRFLPLAANGEGAVQTLSQLPVHRTLPRIRQVGRTEAEAFAVLDFPQGRLLVTTLERPMTLGRLLRMAHDVADALGAAHVQGIAHGELSASSVLLLQDDAALLWDLPLVFVDRLTDRRGEERMLQKLAHTAEFLAPERANGGPATASADVWSLAALVCRAAGAPRPTAASTLGIVHLISTGGWTPKVPERLPQRVKRLLARMLSAETADRPSASEVRAELSGMLQGATTLKELPAVSLEPIVIPARGEEGDLEWMLAPEPPRSAVPDAHAVPTITEGRPTVSAEIEAAVGDRPVPAQPPATPATGTRSIVPWTDPNLPAAPAASERPTRFAGEPASHPAAGPAAPQRPVPEPTTSAVPVAHQRTVPEPTTSAVPLAHQRPVPEPTTSAAEESEDEAQIAALRSPGPWRLALVVSAAVLLMAIAMVVARPGRHASAPEPEPEAAVTTPGTQPETVTTPTTTAPSAQPSAIAASAAAVPAPGAQPRTIAASATPSAQSPAGTRPSTEASGPARSPAATPEVARSAGEEHEPRAEAGSRPVPTEPRPMKEARQSAEAKRSVAGVAQEQKRISRVKERKATREKKEVAAPATDEPASPETSTSELKRPRF